MSDPVADPPSAMDAPEIEADAPDAPTDAPEAAVEEAEAVNTEPEVVHAAEDNIIAPAEETPEGAADDDAVEGAPAEPEENYVPPAPAETQEASHAALVVDECAKQLDDYEAQASQGQGVHQELFTRLLERLAGLSLDELGEEERTFVRDQRKSLVTRCGEVSAQAAQISAVADAGGEAATEAVAVEQSTDAAGGGGDETAQARLIFHVGEDASTSVELSVVMVPFSAIAQPGPGASSPARASKAASSARVERSTIARPAGITRRLGARTMPILDYSRRDVSNLDAIPSRVVRGGSSAGGDEYATLDDAMEARSPRTLWLHDNRLDASAGAVLGGLLSRRPSDAFITRLNLTTNRLGDDGVFGLVSSLNAEAAMALTSLGLGVNGLGDASVVLLAKEMTAGGALDRIAELRLGGNRAIGPVGARALAVAMCSEGGGASTSLTTLHLGHTSIGDEGGAALALAMSEDSHLLTEAGAEEVVSAPAAPCALSVLHLSDSGLGIDAADAFAAALASERCVLRELWLGGNPLGAEGACSLAQSLARAQCLQKLWLDSTGLDDTAAPHIASALRADESPLSELWLGGNALTDAGAAILAAAIVDSPPTARLRKLWLDHTDALSIDGAQALLDATAPRGVGANEDEYPVLGGGDKVEMLWIGGRQINTGERAHLHVIAAPEADVGGEEPGEEAWHEAAGRRAGGMLQLLVDEPDEGGGMLGGGPRGEEYGLEAADGAYAYAKEDAANGGLHEYEGGEGVGEQPTGEEDGGAYEEAGEEEGGDGGEDEARPAAAAGDPAADGKNLGEGDDDDDDDDDLEAGRFD